ncbi:RES family NAD+ phosphorylase [Iodidimonas sp. SYSU 1G8]|uniref:RES family NAD+ phosphorylase n=1 Tax=Iodidimonas sp. SYSU 1G8 TaxID=3133967 RepID=UPI0031FF3A48
MARRPWADLSGEGARRRGGRWHSPGHAVVYLSQEAALPVLEVLVHFDLPPDLLPLDYVLMRVDLARLEAAVEDGPAEPLEVPESRAWGDRWIAEARSPLARVPSVLVPEAANLILNVRHPLAPLLPSPVSRSFAFDPRLLA